MAILMQVVVELVGPDSPLSRPEVDRDEADGGARVLALGGLDGAIAAVNAVLAEQGYELRRVRVGE